MGRHFWVKNLGRIRFKHVKANICCFDPLNQVCVSRLYGPQHEKTCFQGFANNTGADQTAHSRSLISAFVIRILESTIFKLAASKISVL